MVSASGYLRFSLPKFLSSVEINKLIEQLNIIDSDLFYFNYIKEMIFKLTNKLTLVLQNQYGVFYFNYA